MKTKVLKRSIPLWVLIVAMTCVSVVVFSVVQFTYQISNIMTVVADYSIEVWNESKTALVTSIDWEEFASLHETKDTILWIKNVGNKDIRYSWNVTSVVQSWVNEPGDNYGIMLFGEETGPLALRVFNSREYPKLPLPRLRIRYITVP